MVHEVDFVAIPKPFVTTKVVRIKSRWEDIILPSDSPSEIVDVKMMQMDLIKVLYGESNVLAAYCVHACLLSTVAQLSL